jgi:drug/metabolite transporter (DMT)-like permease
VEAVATQTGRRALGIGLAVVSASSFGVMPVLTKVVYEDGADPIGVLAVRFGLAAVLLLLLARLRGEVLPGGRVLRQLLALGGVGYVAQSITYFFALERVPAGLATLLLYLYPALVVLLMAVVFKDRPRVAAIVCVGLATVGTALTIGPVQGGQTLGVLFGLGSALAYACYVVAGSRVHGVGPIATAAVVMSACAISRARRSRCACSWVIVRLASCTGEVPTYCMPSSPSSGWMSGAAPMWWWRPVSSRL